MVCPKTLLEGLLDADTAACHASPSVQQAPSELNTSSLLLIMWHLATPISIVGHFVSFCLLLESDLVVVDQFSKLLASYH